MAKEFYLRGFNMKNRATVLAVANLADGRQLAQVRWRVEGFHSQEAWQTIEDARDLVATDEMEHFVPFAGEEEKPNG